jgi:FkbM family methyltransferase
VKVRQAGPGERLLRSIAYLLQRHVLRRRHLVAHAEGVDLQVRFRTVDAIGRHIYKYGMHEPDLTGLLLRSLRMEAGDVFLDVGANVGWYGLVVGRHQPPGVRIVCFEPDPDTFDLLRQNLSLNGLSRIEARQLAVSDERARRPLFRYADRNTGRHSLLPINEGGEVEVETTTVARFCADEGIDADRIRLIKVDVEGYESFVFRGMGKLLPEVPAILAEYSPRYMRRGGIEPAEYLDPLFQAGFVPYRVGEERLTPLDRSAIEQVQGNANFFWLNTRLRERWPLTQDATAAF